jgi:hypothetical protein
MANNEEPTKLDNLKSVWRKTPPTQRIMIAGFMILPIILINIAFSSFSGKSNKEVGGNIEAESKLAVKVSKANAIKGRDAIIETIGDPDRAALIERVEKAKTLNEAQQGNSSFQSLSMNTNSDDLSPINRFKPTQKMIQARQQTVVAQRVVRERPLQKNTGMGLSNDLLKALEAPIDNPDKPRVEPSSADIYNKSELSGDPMAGMTAERYAKELAAREKLASSRLTKALSAYQAEMKNITSIYTVYEDQPRADENSDGSSTSNRSIQSNSNQGTINKKEKPKMEMLFQPGDQLVAYNQFPVDSRINKAFIMIIAEGILKDARVRCQYNDNGEFLVPTCTEITFQGGNGKFEATAINPETMNGIIDQDIDNDTFMKTLARVGSSIASVAGMEKLKTGIEITQNGQTGNTQQQNTLSNREILIGATAASIGDFVGGAEQYYQSAAVKTIPRETTMLLVLTRSMPDWWGIKGTKNDGW